MIFKLGQKVVVAPILPSETKADMENYFKSSVVVNPPKLENKVYTVLNLRYCPKCGCQKIDIGIPLPNDLKNPKVKCSEAGCGHPSKCEGKWFFNSKYFRPAEYNYETISSELAFTNRAEETSDAPIKNLIRNGIESN